MIGRAALLSALALVAAPGQRVLAADPGVPAQITTVRGDAGQYLLSAAGGTLYWNEEEAPPANGDVCNGECAKSWIPVRADSMSAEGGDWSARRRQDGTRQLAYKGRPLYTNVKDSFPGAQFGAPPGSKWHVMFEQRPLPGAFTLQTTLLGRTLADHKGRTLYSQRSENGAASAPWIPFVAPWLASAAGDWSLLPLPDGGKQWAYKDKRLYLYEKDKDPQDLRGHGLGDGWTAVVLEPPPALPRWMTIQRVDLGWVFADAQGLTLYAPARPETIKIAQTCPKACMDEFWRPVLAAPDETSRGRWLIVDNDAGQRQWSYEGRLVYTHTRDAKPGEMRGNSFAVGFNIGDGFRVIPIDSNLPPPGS